MSGQGCSIDLLFVQATHGITNRLVGGGTAVCLQGLEAGGLGEGWSDAMAEYVVDDFRIFGETDVFPSWVHQSSSPIADFVIGSFVNDDPAGFRSHPYSTNNNTNPLRYSDVASRTEVHDVGEVWANILHNVLAALVDVHGFTQDSRSNPR